MKTVLWILSALALYLLCTWVAPVSHESISPRVSSASSPSLPRGIPGTASDPADTWVKKPYVSTGQAPIPLTNEYGLEINSRDPATHAINQMVTECARAAGIRGTMNKQQMLIMTTCIDITMGRYTAR